MTVSPASAPPARPPGPTRPITPPAVHILITAIKLPPATLTGTSSPVRAAFALRLIPMIKILTALFVQASPALRPLIIV